MPRFEPVQLARTDGLNTNGTEEKLGRSSAPPRLPPPPLLRRVGRQATYPLRPVGASSTSTRSPPSRHLASINGIFHKNPQSTSRLYGSLIFLIDFRLWRSKMRRLIYCAALVLMRSTLLVIRHCISDYYSNNCAVQPCLLLGIAQVLTS